MLARRAAVAAAAAIATFVALGGAAAAAGGAAAPGIRPLTSGGGYFRFAVAPGASTHGAVVISNPGHTTATYPVYAPATKTASTSGVTYGQPTTSGTGTASWVHLAVNKVTLAPGAQATVGFTVTVPADASPGQHVTAIAAQTPAASKSGSSGAGGASTGFNVTSRSVVAIVVTVPGPAAAGVTVGRPKVSAVPGGQQVAIPVGSTGLILEKPMLTATLTRCGSAHPTVSLTQQLSTFVPETSVTYPWRPTTALPAGCYTAHTTAAVPGTAAASRWSGTVTIGSNQVAVPLSHRPSKTPSSSTTTLALLIGVPLEAAAVAVIATILVSRRRRRRLAA